MLGLALASAAVEAAVQPVPAKVVVLTFDDSVASHYTVVRPLLKEYGFGATFFITEGFSFRTNKQDYMTWEQIAELHRDGFEIGNHTRDHLSVAAGTLGRLRDQLQAINDRCVEHGIPKPVSFAYPGNGIHPGGLAILREMGIRFARRGGAPEFAYETGRGRAYEPDADHPLLIPSAGDARPSWTLDSFKATVQQAQPGRVAVVQFHGVPDRDHPWVHTEPALFRRCLEHLRRNGYQAIAVRDLARYVEPAFNPPEPWKLIEQRSTQTQAWNVVRGEIRDAATRQPVGCRLYIQSEPDGRWWFADSASEAGTALSYERRNWVNTNSVEMHRTLSAGGFELRLPPGRYRFTVERGKEYHPRVEAIEVGDGGPIEVTWDLRRWVNMAEAGWYSGDTHVHRAPGEMPNLLLAEDLNVGFPFSHWVTRGFTAPGSGDRRADEASAAEVVRVDASHLYYPRNTEYEIFTLNGRSHTLGAVFVLNHRTVFGMGAPPVVPIAEQARREGALLDLDKHDWPWSMLLVPLMGVDLYELSNNHMWRTEFGFTRWNSPAPPWLHRGGSANGGGELDWIRFTFENYYLLLNCGFRLQPTAGTANGVHPVPLGFGRVYVKVDGPLEYDQWVRGLAAGRSFVTTGPMLMLEANGQTWGGEIQAGRRGTTVRLNGQVLGAAPLTRIEVVLNGRVHESIRVSNSREPDGGYLTSIDRRIRFRESGWVAVRAFEEHPDGRVRFAHSSPVHVTVPEKPLRPRRAEVEYILGRVRAEYDRTAPYLPEAAREEYRRGVQAYERLLDGARE